MRDYVDRGAFAKEMRMRPVEPHRDPNVHPHSAEAGGGVLEEIQRSEDLPGTTSAEDAFSAVMCTLRATLGDGGAERLDRELPAGVRKWVSRCQVHAGGNGERPANRGEFLTRVAEHLEIAGEDAGALSHTVFHAVHRLMSVGEVQEVARQLPDDMRELWTAGDDRGAPYQSSRVD